MKEPRWLFVLWNDSITGNHVGAVHSILSDKLPGPLIPSDGSVFRSAPDSKVGRGALIDNKVMLCGCSLMLGFHMLVGGDDG